MPFEDVSAMSQRLDFVCLALSPQANIRELCRRFGISSRTAYKWIHRYQQDGMQALQEQSRRPKNSPRETSQQMQELIQKLREDHPAWGARKLAARLNAMGHPNVPHPSTITQILRRVDLIDPKQSDKHKAHQRFERSEPNALWQMDFKGHLPMGEGQSGEEQRSPGYGRCHPLTILDDHSRFSLCIAACANERYETVRDVLIPCFERYGMPQQILCDNGAPFGSPYSDTGIRSYTRLEVWLMRQQITTIHGRPAHPQTQGKDERFHRTLLAEGLRHPLRDLTHSQQIFDRFREMYNHERPHQALDYATPSSRYRPSPRVFRLDPPIVYDPSDIVRKVQQGGALHFQGRVHSVTKALRGYPVAIRPTLVDGTFDVYFCTTRVGRIDLREEARSDW